MNPAHTGADGGGAARLIIRGVISKWAVLVATTVYTLLVTPIVIAHLGDEGYGVWSYLNGLMAYSDLFYLGLGVATVRYTAQHLARNDATALNRLVSVVLTVYAIVGMACLAAAAAIAGWVPSFFAEPLAPATARAAIETTVLLGVRVMLIFTSSAFTAILRGHQRHDTVNGTRLATIAMQSVAVPLLLGGEEPLRLLARIIVVTSVFEFAMLFIATRLTARGLRLRPARPRRDELRLLYGFGLPAFFMTLAFKLISYTDTTVIGVVIGAAAVGLYTIPLQLIEYARLFVGGVSETLLPRLTLLTTRGDVDGLRNAYVVAVRAACFLGAFLLTHAVLLGPSFITLWIGPHFGDAATWILCFLAIATWIQIASVQVALPFYQAMHRLGFPCVVQCVEAVVNLGLSIVLARHYGIDGVALATLVPCIFVTGLVLPLWLCRRLALPVWRLVRESLAPALLLALVIVAVHVVAARHVADTSYLVLGGKVLVTAPLAAAVLWATFPKADLGHIAAMVTPRRSHLADSGRRPEGD
jgi:O-antigen/teichoic acid export membrane protein